MIDHVGFAVSDLAKSRAFYEAALAPLGISLLMEVGPQLTGGSGTALGYGKDQLRIIDADDHRTLETQLWDWAPAAGIASVAEFRLMSEKRTTLEFVVDHLARHAPTPQTEIALAAGAPFGTIAINDACTLCMSR